MYERLCEDAARPESRHDFGRDVIPAMIATSRVFAFRFRDRNRKAAPYWRDVGTLDAYYQANLDLIEVDPVLNLYDLDWPIRTAQPMLPPPKTVFAQPGAIGEARRGEAHDSIVCNGCVISGGHIRRSILSPNVRVNSYAVVEESILYEGIDIGRYARIRRAIIDKDVQVPAHTTIGFDSEHDRQRGFAVTDHGVVVVAKATSSEEFLRAKR
jgi:glucose-1-phosphate adenylyltransferase